LLTMRPVSASEAIKGSNVFHSIRIDTKFLGLVLIPLRKKSRTTLEGGQTRSKEKRRVRLPIPLQKKLAQKLAQKRAPFWNRMCWTEWSAVSRH
jgi:hypothetical protein